MNLSLTNEIIPLLCVGFYWPHGRLEVFDVASSTILVRWIDGNDQDQTFLKLNGECEC